MKILLIGAGGVGSAFCSIIVRRDFFESVVVADYALESAERAVKAVNDPRFTARQVDASSADSVAELAKASQATHVLNAVDPRFVIPIFDGAFAAGADYLDMAMTLSHPHPTDPYTQTRREARRLPVRQVRRAGEGRPPRARRHGRRAGAARTCSRATPPTTCSARSTRSASATARTWSSTGYDFAPSVLDLDDDRGVPQPARDLGEGQGLVHHRAVQRARGVRLPRGHRAGRVRERRARGGADDAALGRRQARHLQVRARRRVHRRAQDAAQARARQDREGEGRRPVEVSPRDVVAACCRIPRSSATRCTARPAPASGSRAPGQDGKPRSTYLYHVVDNQWSMKEYGHQCVVWQTAINPVVALELLAERHLDGRRRARPRGVRRRAVPRPAEGRLRIAVGHPGSHGLTTHLAIDAGQTGIRTRAVPTTGVPRHPHVRAADPAAHTADSRARHVRHGQHRLDGAHGGGDRSGGSARARRRRPGADGARLRHVVPRRARRSARGGRRGRHRRGDPRGRGDLGRSRRRVGQPDRRCGLGILDRPGSARCGHARPRRPRSVHGTDRRGPGGLPRSRAGVHRAAG